MKRTKKYFKKTGTTILAFFITIITYAQIIPAIPTAQQQPKWFFPIFVEDATGAKDTIYFGYDPVAEAYYDDTLFGEYFYPMDSGVFKPCVWEYNNTYADVHIKDSTGFQYTFYFFIYNTVFPIKIWWDDITRLRSDSLPFADPPVGAPRGQLIFDIGSCSCLLTNPGKNAWGGHIIISDSAQTGFDSQTIEDTIFLAGSPWPQSFVIYAFFMKWTGADFAGINEIEQNEIKIFPNPVNDFLFIEEKMLNEIYWIYDLSGKEIISGKLINNKVSVDFLSKGMYFLRIYSEKGINTTKFIKS